MLKNLLYLREQLSKAMIPVLLQDQIPILIVKDIELTVSLILSCQIGMIKVSQHW